jgi:membrane protein implicated in regulation of membrane protease activity
MGYAVFTVLSFSDDLISSKRIRNLFRIIALALFIVGPLALIAILTLFILGIYLLYFFPFSLYLALTLFISTVFVSLILRKYRIRVTVETKE